MIRNQCCRKQMTRGIVSLGWEAGEAGDIPEGGFCTKKKQRKCSDGWEEAKVTGQELWFCLVYCFWVQTFRIGWANRLRVTCPDQPPGVSRTFFFLLLLMLLLHLSLMIPSHHQTSHLLVQDYSLFLIICDYFIVSSWNSYTDVLNAKPQDGAILGYRVLKEII